MTWMRNGAKVIHVILENKLLVRQNRKVQEGRMTADNYRARDCDGLRSAEKLRQLREAILEGLASDIELLAADEFDRIKREGRARLEKRQS